MEYQHGEEAPPSPPSPCPSTPEGALLFPARLDRNGAHQVEHIELDTMTRNQLRELCRRFGLRVSGTKQVLSDELRAFSKNRDAWDSVLPGATKPHKGPRSGVLPQAPTASAKALRIKRSTQHRALLLGGDDMASACSAAPHALPAVQVARSKDTCTHAEIEGVLPWADSIASQHPYNPSTADPKMTPDTAPALTVTQLAGHPPLQEHVELQRQLWTDIRECIQAVAGGRGV
ncbi:hypothetical protein PAXINDRAFT_102797, partial [Paxillus involutus ATCC 200175]